jgi:hypothetical protein
MKEYSAYLLFYERVNPIDDWELQRKREILEEQEREVQKKEKMEKEWKKNIEKVINPAEQRGELVMKPGGFFLLFMFIRLIDGMNDMEDDDMLSLAIQMSMENESFLESGEENQIDIERIKEDSFKKDELPSFEFSCDYDKLKTASIFNPPLSDIKSPLFRSILRALASPSYFHFSYNLSGIISSPILGLQNDSYSFGKFMSFGSSFNPNTLSSKNESLVPVHRRDLIPHYLRIPINRLNIEFENCMYLRSEYFGSCLHDCMKEAFKFNCKKMEGMNWNTEDFKNDESLCINLYKNLFESPYLYFETPSLLSSFSSSPLLIYVVWSTYVFSVGLSVIASTRVSSHDKDV